MIITCPECATRYQADAAKFPSAGRKVKCAKCGHAWHQDPPLPEPVVVVEEVEVDVEEPPPPSSPAFAPEPASAPAVDDERPPPQPQPSALMPEPSFDPPPSQMATASTHTPVVVPAVVEERSGPSPWAGRLGVLVGWGLLAAIVIIAGWGAIHYRQAIATAWPQTASLYGAIGMPVNPRGIEFTDVAWKPEKQDGQSVLAITGKLVNISEREQPVPQIRAALADDTGRELYHWTFSAGITTMKPGQTEKFLTRISSPPPGAKHLEVRFAKDGE